jgi:hypothetical protein
MPKPITETLRLLDGGVFLDACADKLAEAVKAVEETGKAGKVTIVIDLKRTGGAIAVTGKVTNKAPEAAPDSTLLWATVEGNLVADNPAQRKLEFREVTKKTEIRDLPDKAAAI